MAPIDERLKQAQLPVCPQMQFARATWLYPVEGYCVQDGPSGYLIPDLGEIRAYCTTGRYCECPWYSASRPVSTFGTDHGDRQVGLPIPDPGLRCAS